MKKSLLIALLVLCFSLLSAAQEISIGVHGSLSPAQTEIEDEEDDTFAFGLHARARIMGRIGIEGMIDFREQDYGDATVSIQPIQISALFYLLEVSQIKLYGIAGLNYTRSSIDDDAIEDADDENDFSYHFGAGLDVGVAPSISVFGDIRYMDLTTDWGHYLGGNWDMSGWQTTVGVSYNF